MSDQRIFEADILERLFKSLKHWRETRLTLPTIFADPFSTITADRESVSIATTPILIDGGPTAMNRELIPIVQNKRVVLLFDGRNYLLYDYSRAGLAARITAMGNKAQAMQAAQQIINALPLNEEER